MKNENARLSVLSFLNNADVKTKAVEPLLSYFYIF
jgi:hypothetical protein